MDDYRNFSNEQSDLLDILKKSKVFLYNIAGKKYYIGGCVCMYDKDDSNLYESFMDEINEVRKATYNIDNRDTKRLVALLEKIMDTDRKSIYEKNDHPDSINKLIDMVSELSEKQIQEIMYQRKCYVEALDYKDGRHYKYNNMKTEKQMDGQP